MTYEMYALTDEDKLKELKQSDIPFSVRLGVAEDLYDYFEKVEPYDRGNNKPHYKCDGGWLYWGGTSRADGRKEEYFWTGDGKKFRILTFNSKSDAMLFKLTCT